MNTNTSTQLEQFRLAVYHSFARRADAAMELLDALTGNQQARSVVELSLAPGFRRTYSSVYAAVGKCFTITKAEHRRRCEETLLRLIAARLARPQRRKFWLFGIDATSVSRIFAPTLPDRGYVHCANPIGGNKPITLGHQYSLLAYLPDKLPGVEPAWIVPLIWRRISTQESELAVGVAQVATLLADERLPFHNDLCVQVDDSRYSTSAFLHPVAQHANLVTIARLRGTRTLYRQAAPVAEDDRQAGHPKWYGEPFALHKPTTWGPPAQTVETTHTSRRGRTYTVQIQAWHDLLMRGTRKHAMHAHLFTLVRVRLLDAAGQPAFKRDLWLVVLGARRQELTLLEIQQAYAQRFDLEHFFRFGKQRLLLTGFQTPEIERETNWLQLVQLAYVQLYLARSLAEANPRPWERYLPSQPAAPATPSATQRAFAEIIRPIGTPAAAPKRRGIPPGRPKGAHPEPRPRYAVVKKTPPAAKKPPNQPQTG
ncbi:MAG: transposase [Chloroflexi bacterium]|nr:transposase [Chloroflexota bacterium]